jgi:transcriptional regulator with XRE-family HTH domain
MKRARTPLTRTTQAAQLLGAQIRIARQERKWTEAQLAERVGISAKTLRNVERGASNVAIGIVFDAATIVGVPLFHEEETRLTADLASARIQLTLLPQRTRRPSRPVNDDF